jgi:hypothetical protein
MFVDIDIGGPRLFVLVLGASVVNTLPSLLPFAFAFAYSSQLPIFTRTSTINPTNRQVALQLRLYSALLHAPRPINKQAQQGPTSNMP